MPPTTRLRARPVRRPVPRTARRDDGQDRPVQAARGLRRVLARRPEAAGAAAHLRHGLVDAGGARHVPVAARGGEEARPPQAGRPARPVLVPRRLAGRRVLAPQGLDALSNAARRDARASRRSAATRRSTRRRSSTRSCGSSRATGTCTATTCSWSRSDDADVQPQADELPRVDVHLPLASVRSYRELPLRLSEYGVLHRNELSGVRSGPDAGPPLRTRTTPTSTSGRTRSRTRSWR